MPFDRTNLYTILTQLEQQQQARTTKMNNLPKKKKKKVLTLCAQLPDRAVVGSWTSSKPAKQGSVNDAFEEKETN